MGVAHSLVQANPKEFRKIFYLLTRLNSNYAEVVSSVIPSNVPSHHDYPKDLYYKWALNDALRAKNLALADAVWNAIPSELKHNSDYGLTYLQFLAKLQQREKIMFVWEELVGNEVVIGQIYDPSFERRNSPQSPCWNRREVKGAEWSLVNESFKGPLSLLINFSGEENVLYAHVSCMVLVEPGRSYTLKGMWSGKGISTLSGIFLDITSPGVRSFYKRSDVKLGDWEWSRFTVNFNVPDNVHALIIRVRRKKTDLLDNKISGKVWFDQFELIQNNTKTSSDPKGER